MLRDPFVVGLGNSGNRLSVLVIARHGQDGGLFVLHAVDRDHIAGGGTAGLGVGGVSVHHQLIRSACAAADGHFYAHGIGQEVAGADGEADGRCKGDLVVFRCLRCIDDRDLARLDGAGEHAVFHGERAAVGLVGVGAVRHGGGGAEVNIFVACIDDHRALVGVAALDHHDLCVAGNGIGSELRRIAHLVAEEVDRDHLRILVHIAAGRSDPVVAPRIIGTAVVRTVEEQRCTVLSRGNCRPRLNDLLCFGQLLVGLIVAVVVVGLNPSDGLIRLGAVGKQRVGDKRRVEVLVGDRVADTEAGIGVGGVHVVRNAVLIGEGLAVVGVQTAAVVVVITGLGVFVGMSAALLQHLAVLEGSAVLEDRRPEVACKIITVFFGGVVGQLDELCRVVAEAVGAAFHTVPEEVENICLHGFVLGIQLIEPAQIILRLFVAIDLRPVLSLFPFVTHGMERLAVKVFDVVGNLVIIGGGVVEHGVNDDLDAVGMRRVAHRLEFFLGAKLIVADLVVGGLIVPPPVVAAGDRQRAVAAVVDLTDRRGLDRRKACCRDLGNILADGVEIPAPAVQDRTALHSLGQAVRLQVGACVCRFCRHSGNASCQRLRQQNRRYQRCRANAFEMFHMPCSLRLVNVMLIV